DVSQVSGKVGLAAAGGHGQEHLRLRELDVAAHLRGRDPLVVVVDLDREHLLGVVLADHVLVERGADRLRVGDEAALLLLRPRRAAVLLKDLLAEVDALVADVHARAGHELADLVLTLPAERASRVAAAVFSIVHGCVLGGGRSRWIMAAEDLVCKRDALAADIYAGAGDKTHAAVAVDLAAEGALRLVAHHLGVLLAAAEDHR